MRNFTSVNDVENINTLVNIALDLKKSPFRYKSLGKNKTLGLIFLNPSLRTRLSTQKAARNLGMDVMVMNFSSDGWGIETEEGVIMNGVPGEHIKEAAAVIGAYCDIIGVRSFPELKNRDKDYEDKIIKQFMAYSGKPVISLESATRHPLQSLADLVTIKELTKVTRPKVVLSWAPHVKALPQAVPNSFAEWMCKSAMEFVITHPKGYELNEEFTKGAKIEYDQNKAFEGADFIYAKNWSTYNGDYGKIINSDPSWMITNKKMALTNEAKFMHCLPVRRNVVVADEVLDGPNSIVIQEAGNRVFAAQAVLKEMLDA